MRIWNHGGDHTVIDGDRHAHVYVGVQTDSLRAPTGIQPGMVQEDTRYESDQQVSMGNAHTVLLLDLFDDASAELVECAGFDLAGHEEVRDGRPTLRSALGHQTADGGWNLDPGGFFFG